LCAILGFADRQPAEAADLVITSGTTTINSGTSFGGAFVASSPADTATLSLAGGVLNLQQGVFVGGSGNGSLLFVGGSLSAGYSILGRYAGSSGTAAVSSGNWSSDTITVGSSGNGVLNMTGGVVVNNILSNQTSFTVGESGTGVVNVSGGSLASAQVAVGYYEGSVGTVTMTGGTWSNSGNFVVGSRGEGNLNLNGGTIASEWSGTVGAGGVGKATITSGTWSHDYLEVGMSNTGTMSVIDGSIVTRSSAILGRYSGAQGAVVVSGGTWSIGNELVVGLVGDGALSLSGGSITTINSTIGGNDGGVGIANVSGGRWENGSDFRVGGQGSGTLNLTGGAITSKYGSLGFFSGGVGTAAVSSGTLANEYFYIGLSGTGALNLDGGVVASSSNTILGAGAGSVGTATIAGGTMAAGGNLVVGSDGTGTLTMTGGLVSVGGALTQGTYGTINLNSGGALQIGVGGTTGVLGVDALTNNGTLIFNRSDASTYAGVISGSGALVKQGAGTLTLAGNNTYSGATTVSEGGLTVNGTNGPGGVTVASGAMLSGTGTLGGNAIVHGGHMLGNPVGTQTISGNLTYSREHENAAAPSVYWELLANTETDTGAFGHVSLAGNLDFSTITNIDLSFDGAGSSVLWSNSFWDSDEHWTIYSVGGATANFSHLVLNTSTWFDSLGNSFGTTLSGASFWLSRVGSDVVLNYSRSSSSVPEIDPSSCGSAVALLLGAFGLCERRNRWRNRAGI